MDIKEFKQYAANAQIGFFDGEDEVVFQNFSILEKELERVKNTACDEEPLITVCTIKDIVREDVSKKMISKDELMRNAIEEHNGYFQVPKVLE